jgi:predicted peroxiredoxin
MKRFALLLILISALTACHEAKKHDHDSMGAEKTAKSGELPACCAVKDGVFIHISSGYENPHKALMPLKMALMMSKDKDVLLYLDIEAVKMVLKDSKDMTFKEFHSLKEMLKQLIDAKVTIMACPTCMKVAGKTEADLMPGVILAQKDKFFNFTKGKIITLDY